MKVTIKVERDDGQFVTVQTEIPDRGPTTDFEDAGIRAKISRGFYDAWQTCWELPR